MIYKDVLIVIMDGPFMDQWCYNQRCYFVEVKNGQSTRRNLHQYVNLLPPLEMTPLRRLSTIPLRLRYLTPLCRHYVNPLRRFYQPGICDV